MAVTLAEYKKMSQNVLILAVAQIYLDNSPIMNYLKFTNINGGTIEFLREKTLPDTGFRTVGVAYTTSEGELETVTESLKIAGGKITVDRALVKLYGTDRLVEEQMMQLKSLARTANLAFFKGDGTGGSFTGLQVRATNVIPQGTAALSLSNLRKAVVRCKGTDKKIFMNEEMYLKLADAGNSTTLGGLINISKQEFGEPVTYFAGVEVIRAGQDNSGDEVLGFTEASSTTSIYVVSFDEEGMKGVQNGDITDYTPVTESHANEYDIEWLMSYIIRNPAAVQRISEITNAAIVA